MIVLSATLYWITFLSNVTITGEYFIKNKDGAEVQDREYIKTGDKIVLANGTVVTDDGAGALSDGGTIDYASGLITPASAFVAGDKISYTYDNSIVPNYLYPELDGHNQHQVGDVTIGIRPELIQAEEHKIRAVYALTSAYKINKEYGVNMPLEFEKQVANEMNKERERVVMSDIFAQAAGGNAVVWSSTPRPRSFWCWTCRKFTNCY